MGPAAPNPTAPRAMGATIGVRRTPAQAPATVPTRRRLSGLVKLNMTDSREGGKFGRSMILMAREIQALNRF